MWRSERGVSRGGRLARGGLLLLAFAAAGWSPAPVGLGPGPARGSVDGYPLPRFVSLRTDEVNFRAGPGFQYPVVWIYQRKGLPVEVIGEFDVWRHVVAPDGGSGWVHEATIRARRGFFVTAPQAKLQTGPNDGAGVAAVLDFGVSGDLLRCKADADWCEVSADRITGYLRREDFWGAFAGEAVGGS